MEYPSSKVRVAPISWVVGAVTQGELFGEQFLVHSKEQGSYNVMTCADLPCELWNHELASVECESEDSVIEFVRSFGFPFSPMRNSESCMVHSFDYSLVTHMADAIGATDNLTENDYCGLMLKGRNCREAACDPTISLSEATETIRAFQIVISNLSDAVKGTDHFRFADFVNAGSCNPMIATNFNIELIDRNSDSLIACGLLTSAICNQIIEAMADTALWKECACEGCGRVFKRKHGAKNPNAVSRYCCTECENRQRKRNQRAAAKSRIKH